MGSEVRVEKNGSKYRIPDLIMKKRDGHALTHEEIDYFIKSICDHNNNNLIQESQIG
jgi:thymidine phosphorylase